jgi:hypothetical protein
MKMFSHFYLPHKEMLYTISCLQWDLQINCFLFSTKKGSFPSTHTLEGYVHIARKTFGVSAGSSTRHSVTIPALPRQMSPVRYLHYIGWSQSLRSGATLQWQWNVACTHSPAHKTRSNRHSLKSNSQWARLKVAISVLRQIPIHNGLPSVFHHNKLPSK